MKKFHLAGKLFVLLLALSVLAACAQKGGGTFTSSGQQRSNAVHYGTVLSVRTVKIENDTSGVGPVVGGVAGGVVGNLFGSGSGKVLATVGGAALGALGGYATENVIRNHDALEIIVELDNGSHIAVVQDPDIHFRAGDKVMVLAGSDGSSRVQPR